MPRLARVGTLNRFRSSAAAGTPVPVTTDLQSYLTAGVTNQTFRLAAGTFRLAATCVPKDGQVILGATGGGTILSGAQLITSWTSDGGSPARWSKTGQTQSFAAHTEGCDLVDGLTYNQCKYSEQYYYDSTWLLRAESLATGVSGRFFFDDATNTVYIWDDPNGHTVEAAITQQAFQGFAGTNYDITIKGMTLEKFSGAPTSVSTRAAIKCGSNWLVDNCEIRLNRGIGVTLGSGSRLVNSYLHHNGQYGFNGSGAVLLIDNNVVTYNNQARYDPFWDGGGSKITNSSDVTFSNNTASLNHGPGLWCDGDVLGATFTGNTCEDNAGGGIFFEVSYNASIHDNTLRRNNVIGTGLSLAYGGDITIGTSGGLTESDEVAIYGNLVETYQNGISVIDASRGHGAYGKFQTRNVRVGDAGANTVKFINDSGTSTPLWAAGLYPTRSTRTVTTKSITSTTARLVVSTRHEMVATNIATVESVGAPFDGSWTVTAVQAVWDSGPYWIEYTIPGASDVTAVASGGTVSDYETAWAETSFSGNAYEVPTSGSNYWVFAGNKTWTAWQAYPQDATGSRTVVP